MAQWNALHELVAKEKIKASSLSVIYGIRMGFPVSLRQQYATWIESKEWPSVTDTSKTCEEYERLYQEFVDLINNDLEQMGPSVNKIAFKNTVDAFVENFQYRYAEFVKVISTILRTEKNLILSSREPSKTNVDDDGRFVIAQDNPEIMNALTKLKTSLRVTENGLSRLEEEQEKYLLDIQDLQEKMTQQKKQLDRDPEARKRYEKMEKEYTLCLKKLHTQRMDITTKVHEACIQLESLLPKVWKEIDAWKCDQRLACTMLCKPKEQIMEVLDRMGEGVGEVFIQVLQQIDKLVNLLQKVPFQNDVLLPRVKDQIRLCMIKLLEAHLKKVFIVDKNIPKQVLKVTNGKSLGFSMSVRFLGGFAFGLNVNQPKVSVKLYPEKQIREVMAVTGKTVPNGCCRIQNGEDKSFEFLRSGSCMANFNNMEVRNVKREGRGRNDDFVTDYKHAFIFMSSIKILTAYCHDTLEFHLKAMSLPLVITSQTSQECMARGTIIWSAAFPKEPEDEKGLPFQAMEEVPWVDVAKVINAMFREYTARPLLPDHLRYLAKIAFRESKDLDFDKMSISRNAILKDKLPNKEGFPFWKWLMACLNSVKGATLHSEWKENLIYGFISKDEAERKLQDHPAGTFLIRFSESNIEQGQSADIHGFLTVAVSEINPKTGGMSVFHVKESLTPKDLKEKHLAPILEAYETDDYTRSTHTSTHSKKLLKNLWTPGKLIPFDECFGKYVKQKEAMNDGYHRGRFLIKIYLADTSDRDRHWPMSPPNIIPPASPATSDMNYSDVGSPNPDIFPLPSMPVMPQQPQQQQPQQQPQQMCVVQPFPQQIITPEPTLNQIQFSPSLLVNGLADQQAQQLQQQQQHQFNLGNLDQVLNDMIINQDFQASAENGSLPILTVDNDNDIMLNIDAASPSLPTTSGHFTTIQNAMTISMQQDQFQ